MQGKFIVLTNGLTHAHFEVDQENQQLIELEQIPVNS
jgi:hypothetical protein